MTRASAPVASIDLGSNAVRLMVGKINSRGRVQVMDEMREPLRLGSDSFSDGRVSAESERRLVQTLLLFKYWSWRHGVTDIRAVGTSALRSARNGSQVISRVERETGIRIHLVDGIEEAYLIHEAVRRHVPLGNKPALLLDLGGGSLEWIVSSKQRVRFAHSIPLGTVRLLHRLGRRSFQSYSDYVHDQVHRFIRRHPILESVVTGSVLVGTGGNFRCLGRLAQHVSKKADPGRVSIDHLAELAPWLFEIPMNKRMRMFDLRADRADVILPASVIALEVMKALNFSSMMVPDVGIKTGVFYRRPTGKIRGPN